MTNAVEITVLVMADVRWNETQTAGSGHYFCKLLTYQAPGQPLVQFVLPASKSALIPGATVMQVKDLVPVKIKCWNSEECLRELWESNPSKFSVIRLTCSQFAGLRIPEKDAAGLLTGNEIDEWTSPSEDGRYAAQQVFGPYGVISCEVLPRAAAAAPEEAKPFLLTNLVTVPAPVVTAPAPSTRGRK
jgi:hypothetical protein